MSRGPRAIVAGAGPAGAAAAIWLARAGCSTTIITRDSRHAVTRGETFAEAGLEALRVLGVRDRFLAAAHRPCRRTCVAWGESALTTHDHLFRLHGNGWQIDRALFDSMLGEAAEAAGVRVFRGACVTGVERFDPRWSVQFLTADGPLTEECEWLIDATGRCAALSRMIGARWVETDHLIAQIGRFASRSDRSAGEGVLLVESAEHGWWYSVVPPDGTLLAAHVTDRDRTARGRWALELESTQHTRDGTAPFIFGHDAMSIGLRAVGLAQISGAGAEKLGIDNNSAQNAPGRPAVGRDDEVAGPARMSRGREASGPTGTSADEVRTRYQSQDRESAGPHRAHRPPRRAAIAGKPMAPCT